MPVSPSQWLRDKIGEFHAGFSRAVLCLPPTSVGGGRHGYLPSAGFSRAFITQSRWTFQYSPVQGASPL